MLPRMFRVTFFYREPGYEARRGARDKPYRGTFSVRATDPDEAVARAREAFNRWAMSSSVSWAREIVDTQCRAMDDPDTGSVKLVGC